MAPQQAMAELQARGSALGASSAPAARVIRLSVGGTRYETSQSTLDRSPFFEYVLSGRNGDPLCTDDGAIFIDRDGALFAPILAFLRGARPRLGQLDRYDLLEEARYYLIDDPRGKQPFRDALDRISDGAGGEVRRAEVSRDDIVKALLHRGSSAPLELAGISLRGVDLSGLNLAQANLQGSDLTQAKLCGTILVGARLTRAELTDAVFTGADFSRATLTGARLNVERAGKLEGANFQDADLRKVY
jgi:hypothetical protein